MSRRPPDPDRITLRGTVARNERARSPVSQTQGYFDTIDPPPRSGRAREVDLSPSTGPRRKPAKKSFAKVVANEVNFAKERIAALQDCAHPRELVGLYALLHEQTFKTIPLELNEHWGAAVSAAGKLVRDEFGGDVAKAEHFVAWCWRRVRLREKRRDEGDEAFRPGWRLQFKSTSSWVTDYRVAMTKKSGR